MWQQQPQLQNQYDGDSTTITTTTIDTTAIFENHNNSHYKKITVKAAVHACWPNETILDIIRLIKQGHIEVSTSTKATTHEHQQQPIKNHHHFNNDDDIGWTIVRQHGKRIIHPNQWIRRRRRCQEMISGVDEVQNNQRGLNNCQQQHYDDSQYEIRMVPSYPIVIVMNKPCGYVVTTAGMKGNVTNVMLSDQNQTNVLVRPEMNRNSLDRINDDDEEEGKDDDDSTVEDENTPSSDTISSSLSISVYNLLTMSSRYPNDNDDIIHDNTTPPLCSSSSNNNNNNNNVLQPYHLSQLRAVGRLDKNTEGLLLFTNHGRWNIALTHPIIIQKSTTTSTMMMTTTMTEKNHQQQRYTIWKTYRCILQKPATESDLQYWINGGIPFRHMKSLNGIAYSLPAQSAQFVSYKDCISVVWEHLQKNHTASNNSNNNNDDDYNIRNNDEYYSRRIVDVTIGEGKYRQVRRCWESLSNNKVLYLQRLSFGPIELLSAVSKDRSQLQPGQWRMLSTTELHLLEQYVHMWYRNNPNYQH